MKFVLNCLFAGLLFVVSASSSEAWPVRGRGGAQGNSTLNIGGGQATGFNFLNIIKIGNPFCDDVTDLQYFDDDGMPVGTLTGTGVCGISNMAVEDGTQYRIIIPAGTAGKWGFSLGGASVNTCTNASNVTILSCPGSFAVWESTNGAGGSFDFTADTNTGAALFLLFDDSGTFSHTLGNAMALIRVSDQTKYNQYLADGLDPFTDEFPDSLTPLVSKWLRTMGWSLTSNTGPTETIWATRNQPSTATWNAHRTPKGYLAGSSGSCGLAVTICNTGNAYYADPGTSSPADWTDGEILIGKVLVTSTGPATFAIGARASTKTACNSFGSPAIVGEIVAGPGTWVYNAVLNCVMFTGQSVGSVGIRAGMPLEVRVALANLVNSNYWHTFPITATNDYVTQELTYIRDNLSASLNVTLELSNEEWNPGFINYHLSNALAFKYGWGGGNGAGIAYQGYRSRQIFADIVPTVFTGGQADRVVPFAGLQACCSTAPTSPIKSYVLDGVDLRPNVTRTVTATIATGSPCIITWPHNDFSVYDPWPVSFTSTGTLPTGITSTTIYYTVPGSFTNQYQSNATFQISDTAGGAAKTCGGSPTGTITASYVNTLYNALDGGDYSDLPNRPVDYYKKIGGAPYSGGTNMCNHTDNGCVDPYGLYGTWPAGVAPFWQALVDAAALGDWTTTRAMIDKDQRSGRRWGTIQNVTASGTTFTTGSPHGFTASGPVSWVAFEVTGGTMYAGIVANKAYCVTSAPTTTTFTIQPFVDGQCSGSNVNAGSAGTGTVTVGNMTNSASHIGVVARDVMRNDNLGRAYNSDRPVGMAPLLVGQYEGNIEINPLVPTWCTTLGITGHTASDCAQLTLDAVDDFLINSTLARTLTYDYYSTSNGTNPLVPDTYGLITNSREPAWLVLSCGGQYGMIAGGPAGSGLTDCQLTDPPNPKRQYYYGVQDFNTTTQPPLPRRRPPPPANDNVRRRVRRRRAA